MKIIINKKKVEKARKKRLLKINLSTVLILPKKENTSDLKLITSILFIL